MKKSGFTLVELLAVIVVLAIIALIATPTILGVINKAKKGALKDSAYGLVDAATLYYAQYGESARFDFDGKGNVTSNTNNKLGYKGKVENGTLLVNNQGKVMICINDGENAAYKNYSDTSIVVVTGKTCNVNVSETQVLLDGENTIGEYTNQELTTLVDELQTEVAALKAQLGTTDISGVADGTVTGSVNAINNDVNELNNNNEWKRIDVSLAFTSIGYDTINYQNNKLINAKEVVIMAGREKIAHFTNALPKDDTSYLNYNYSNDLYCNNNEYFETYISRFYPYNGTITTGCIAKGSQMGYKRITYILYR